jgi:hypothetical protein
MADDAGQLILIESQRQLDRQSDAHNTVKTTAAAVITSAAVAAAVFASVLTAEKTRSHASIGAEVAALAMFTITVCISAWLIGPHKWNDEHELTGWIDRIYAGEPPSQVTTIANFAKYANDFRQDNVAILKRLQCWQTAACVLLGLQVVAWALAVL